MLRVLKIVYVMAVIIVPHTAAAACSKANFTSAHLRAIPAGNIDQTAFSQALTLEASSVRCSNGRAVLQTATGLTKIAAAHSRWMGKARKLSHTSTIAGRQKMSSRIKASGVKYRTAAENIARFSRYQFGTKTFKIKNAAKCQFQYSSGKPIPLHSYASLAKVVVSGWMTSSGHKKNLMNRRMKQAGGGLGFDPKGDHCGHYYITQNYSG